MARSAAGTFPPLEGYLTRKNTILFTRFPGAYSYWFSAELVDHDVRTPRDEQRTRRFTNGLPTHSIVHYPQRSCLHV